METFGRWCNPAYHDAFGIELCTCAREIRKIEVISVTDETLEAEYLEDIWKQRSQLVDKYIISKLPIDSKAQLSLRFFHHTTRLN